MKTEFINFNNRKKELKNSKPESLRNKIRVHKLVILIKEKYREVYLYRLINDNIKVTQEGTLKEF